MTVGVTGCAPAVRRPRPTILTEQNPPPPPPAPEANEERLRPVELHPGITEPIETPPSTSLGAMARRALDAAQADILGCYEAILPTAPDAEGSIELQIDLTHGGHVSRVTVDHLARQGLDQIVPCVRDVVQRLELHDVEPNGHYVSEIYVFHNPPIELPQAAAVTITPPARVARRTGRASASATPASAAPSSSAPPTARGALTSDEIAQTIVGTSSGLAVCYATVLRRVRTAAGPALLTLDISGRGDVESAHFETPTRPLEASEACVVAAARALHFRNSGTHTHVPQRLMFARTVARAH